MRKLYAVLIAVGLAFAVAGQASAVSVTLSQVGGTYAGPVGSPSDTLVLSIDVTLAGGEAVTGVFAALDLNACGGCSFLGGTEQAFNFVGGVLLTPIGAPGGDIGPGVAPGTIKGWENQTLTVTGAPGPATFSIGTASFHLSGSGTISVGGASVATGDTIIGGANFVDITGTSTLGSFAYVIPEPTTFALLGLGLAGLAWAGRRES